MCCLHIKPARFLAEKIQRHKNLNMKLLLVVLALAQITGALSTSAAVPEPRALLDIWDLISPFVTPIAQGLDTTLATISNAHSTVTNAVSGAIYGLTSWIGGKIPALGKRDVSADLPSTLLNELRAFQVGFQQQIIAVIQKLLGNTSLNLGNIIAQLRQLLSQMSSFMQTQLNKIKSLLTSLIPNIQDTTATQAISGVLNAVQVIEQAIQSIQALFSS